jgi:hypothetical protein
MSALEDVPIGEYFEYETMFLHEKASSILKEGETNIFKEWKNFYTTEGTRPEYDILIEYTDNTSDRIEVKAQTQDKNNIYIEYEQIYKGDDINDVYPSGFKLSTSDYYYIYSYSNKNILFTYINNRYFGRNFLESGLGKKGMNLFKYDLYIIPTTDIEGWFNDIKNNVKNPNYILDEPQSGRASLLNNNTYDMNYGFTLKVNKIFLKKYKKFSNILTPIYELDKYLCRETSYTDNDIVKYVNNKPELDINKDVVFESSNIKVLEFSKDCNRRRTTKDYKELFGSGKHCSPSNSDSSSSSEGEETSLKVYNRLKRNINKKYKIKKEKYL